MRDMAPGIPGQKHPEALNPCDLVIDNQNFELSAGRLWLELIIAYLSYLPPAAGLVSLILFRAACEKQ